MIFRKFDSLFMRLALAQTVLLVSSLLVIGGLLVIERNQLSAPEFAILLAPSIKVAVQADVNQAVPVDGLGLTIRRHAQLPDGWKLRIYQRPAVADFVRALAKYQVVVDDVWLNRRDGHFTLWVHVLVPGSAPVWLSGNVPSALPEWAPRMTVGLVLLVLVSGLVSWGFAIRVTRPLSQLRNRMQLHAHNGVEPTLPWPSMQSRKAPPELVEIENAYRLLAERLQRNERERALLLAGVSHDLRSPLSRIRLAAEMLPESADNAAGVASITRNVDHADRLTSSFLEFIRASTVAMDEVVDLAAVALEAVVGFERPVHELQLSSPDSMWLQRAHGLLVQRLIINLVDNALKHGGLPVEVDIAEEGGWATMTVSDTGPGLPQNGDGRLMEAFARGDASRGLPGFGLGLAIAQQIVVRLHGELRFAQDGALHQVVVRLPLQG
ncbi:MAG: ATP-binding protein [Burkholderiales bacterium]|nr:ATP-binding protein [Burkholderiales bacterium]